jgi:Glycosyltransferase like family 2
MGLFSVIIPWFRRPEVRQTLEANAGMFERHSAEVIIVNCGAAPDELTPFIRDVPVSVLRHIVIPTASFNKSLANNIGALCSSGRFLFFSDADILLRSDLLSRARATLERQRCFVKIRAVHESQPKARPALQCVKRIVETRDIVFANARRVRLRFFQTGFGSRCGSGLLLMRKRHLLAAGGFNSALHGWGFEDIDLHIRLQVMANISLVAVGSVVHLTHGDDTRNIRSGSREDDTARNVEICFENYSRGMYTGSYVEDVRQWRHAIREVPVIRSSAARPTFDRRRRLTNQRRRSTRRHRSAAARE